jgi:phosphopantothenate synthetase
MTAGDAAAAKGWTTYPNTQAHSLGFQDINEALDRLAAEQDAPVAADALKLDASKLIISTTTPTVVNGALWAKPVS